MPAPLGGRGISSGLWVRVKKVRTFIFAKGYLLRFVGPGVVTDPVAQLAIQSLLGTIELPSDEKAR